MTVYEMIRKHREVGCNDDPQFDKARRVGDWRNYVPDEIIILWKDLSVETRVMIFVMAEQRANLENWDK